MARSYATVSVKINEEMRDVPAGPRMVYNLLFTQADIAACGYLALTLRRWSLDMAEQDREHLPEWLAQLEAERYVIIDRDTEELLVRTFAKHDGGYKNAKRLLAVKSSANAIRSPLLRSVLTEELAKLGVSDWDKSETEPPSIPDRTPTDPARSVVTYVSTDHTPHSTNLESEPAAIEGGTRPDNDFCEKHQPYGTDEDCGQCARKRTRNERLRTDRQRREEEHRSMLAQMRKDCPECDDNGMITDPDGSVRRCLKHIRAAS